MAIIGLILAIVLPAVQSGRESARRLQCQNHLRQILLAAQSHHSTHNALPSLYNGTALTYPLQEWDLFHQHSWRAVLLPELEQSPLRERIQWKELATAVANSSVSQTVVPVFLCPSGGPATGMGSGVHHGSIGIPREKLQAGDWYAVVRSDYDAMAGIQDLPDPLPPGAESGSVDFVHWGIWGWPVFEKRTIRGSRLSRYRPGKFSDVTDGLSNTIAVVERGGKPIDLLNGKRNVTPDNPDAVYPGQVGWSASNTFAWSINADGVGINQRNATGIYSLHPQGANVALADGSVRFLSQSMDFKALVSLYGRSDGGLPE
jgi:prepilin-type processing-associated H-X9-DG protein